MEKEEKATCSKKEVLGMEYKGIIPITIDITRLLSVIARYPDLVTDKDPEHRQMKLQLIRERHKVKNKVRGRVEVVIELGEGEYRSYSVGRVHKAKMGIPNELIEI